MAHNLEIIDNASTRELQADTNIHLFNTYNLEKIRTQMPLPITQTQ